MYVRVYVTICLCVCVYMCTYMCVQVRVCAGMQVLRMSVAVYVCDCVYPILIVHSVSILIV